MKLTFLVAPTKAKANTLAYLEIGRLIQNSETNYIIVPDRATLKTELELIKSLKISGVFNTQVLTINTLAGMVLEEETNTLSSFGAQLLIKKIINENKNNLTCFSKMANNVNFAFELYKTIEQFKSSGIEVSELENAKNIPGGVKLKLLDIALIWKKYEETIAQNYSDGFSRINQLIKAIPQKKDIFKNANFFFLNFEKATNQNLKVVFEVIKQAKSAFVSFAAPSSKQQNSDIYEMSVYNKIKEFAIDSNISAGEIRNNETTCLEENLLAFNLGDKKKKTQNITLKSFENVSDEISNVAQSILNEVADGARFDDFNVVVCDEASCLKQIKDIFQNYKVPFFVDEEIDITSHSLTKLVISIINCLVYNFQSDFVLQIIKNEFMSQNLLDVCDFENYVYKYAVENAMFFNDFRNENANGVRLKLAPIISHYKNFMKAKTANEFLEVLECIFADLKIEDKLNQLLQEQEKYGQAELKKISEQILEKIGEVFNDVRCVLKNTSCTKEEFKNLIIAGLMQKKISLVPVKTNSVYVGTFGKSYFEKDKNNYIICANINSFPSSKADVGIISDEEADVLSFKNKLDPSIKILNKRAMFEAFEIICSCNNLQISFSKNVGSENVGESIVLVDLKNIFNIETVHHSKLNDLMYLENSKCISLYQAKNIFAKELFKIKNKKSVLSPSLVTALGKVLEFKDEEKSNSFIVKNMLKNNEFSVTKLERYFECPFKHFLLEVLKLKKREQCVIDYIDVGNIYHDWARLFVKNSNKINSKNKKEIALKIFDEITNGEKFAEIKQLEKNKPIFSSMRKEVVKLADLLLTHINQTNFEPQYLEKEFGSGKILKSPILKSKNKNYFFKGKIDRIDVCSDYARVIDYKTGGDKFNFAKIFYGKKIQLVAYLMCVCENNFKPVGAYYFPLKTQKTKKAPIQKLDGITLKDLDVVLKMDKNLKAGEKSSLIDVKLNENLGFNGNVGKSTLLTEKEFSSVLNYVNKLCVTALDEICDGNIKPSPLEMKYVECERCPFKGMSCCCDVNVRQSQNVKKDDFTQMEVENEQ